MNRDILPCQADIVSRIRKVRVNGIPIGIARLDEIIDEVKGMNLASDQERGQALLKRVKMYNYILEPGSP